MQKPKRVDFFSYFRQNNVVNCVFKYEEFMLVSLCLIALFLGANGVYASTDQVKPRCMLQDKSELASLHQFYQDIKSMSDDDAKCFSGGLPEKQERLFLAIRRTPIDELPQGSFAPMLKNLSIALREYQERSKEFEIQDDEVFDRSYADIFLMN